MKVLRRIVYFIEILFHLLRVKKVKVKHLL